MSVRYDAGLINASDVARAKAQLAVEKAELSQGLLERANDEHLLATLLGYVASDYSLDVCPLTGNPPCVAPCLPSELLQRRPDIHETERRLAAENARIGVARSLYFPSLQLTGALGFASPTIGDLFDWQARLWLWAVSAAQTLYDAGKTSAAVEEAKARYLQTVADYTKTTLNAFKEVESALAAERFTQEKLASYGSAVQASRDAAAISQERYLKGLFTYLEVEDANRTLLANRLQLERSRYQEYEAAISLVKALGGGFPCR